MTVRGRRRGRRRRGRRTLARRLQVEQIEFASHVLTKADLAALRRPKRRRAPCRPNTLHASALRPRRVALDDVLDPASTTGAARPSAAWNAELRACTPRTDAYWLGSFVHRARTPFHPGRLHDLLSRAGDDGVVRGKGFLWLATRPDHVLMWSRAGASWSVTTIGMWWAAADDELWPDEPEARALIEQVWGSPTATAVRRSS